LKTYADLPIHVMKECRKFSAKFNMTKITASLQLGAPAARGSGPMVRLARG